MKILSTGFFLLAGLSFLISPLRGEERTLYILHTNNTNGALENCYCPDHPLGSLEKRVLFVNAFLQEHPNTIVVDAGDLFSVTARPLKDSLVTEAYRLIPYDAILPGDQELVSDPSLLERLLPNLGAPLVATNLQTRLAPLSWVYQSNLTTGPHPHGVVVDPAGKIWVGYYGYRDSLITKSGVQRHLRPIYIYNPDGSQASFSPLRFLTFPDGRVDTLFNGCRGITLDQDGNVLYSAYDDLWQIDYRSGAVIGALYDFPGAITEAAMTADGHLFVTQVEPGENPIWVFDACCDLPSARTKAAEWEALVNRIEPNTTISRSLLVSPDGKELYQGRIYGGPGNNGILHYRSDSGPEGRWTIIDTLYPGKLWGQVLDWAPDGKIWVGSYWDVADSEWRGYYLLDPAQEYALVDSIGRPLRGTPINPRGQTSGGDTIYAPRGIAFSAAGRTAYSVDFDGHAVKTFQRDQPAGEPYRIVERGGLTVAILGVVDPEVFKYYPPAVRDRIKLEDPLQVLRLAIRELAERVDIIILLTHQGYEKDLELAQALEEVDVIVGSHTQSVIQEPQQTNGTLVAQAGKEGYYVGVIELRLDENGQLVSASGRLEAMTLEMPDHPRVMELIREYEARTGQINRNKQRYKEGQ